MDGSNLNDKQKEYLDYCLNGAKLSRQEEEALFGSDLESLKRNVEIQNIIANHKIEKQARKNIVDKFHAKRLVDLFPIALETLEDVMTSGKEHNRVTAALSVIKPVISYLEKHGINVANVESEASEKESRAEKIKIVIDADDANL